jgi:hypothetical protein
VVVVAPAPAPAHLVSLQTQVQSAVPAAIAPAEDECQRFAGSLPSDYLVFAAGDSTAATQVPGVKPLQINGAGQAIVLVLGSAGPTVWDVHVQESENVVGVILSGLHRSTIIGAPANVPVLRAARDDHAPCGYFQINPDTPQGANRFVSRLLVHAVDATLSPPAPTFSRVDIGAATYSSARNGRSLEITSIIRSQCAGNQGACTIHCGNQLAGDPDFGQVKSCQVLYTCGLSQSHTTRVQEGMTLQLRCD